jgi:hypothetical protein
MNRRKRIGFVVDSHSVHLLRVIFCRYGLGEVLNVHFGLLLLGFSDVRWIYYRGLTFLLLGGLFYERSITFFLFGWRINRCLLLRASYKQREGTKQVNITFSYRNRTSGGI